MTAWQIASAVLAGLALLWLPLSVVLSIIGRRRYYRSLPDVPLADVPHVDRQGRLRAYEQAITDGRGGWEREQ